MCAHKSHNTTFVGVYKGEAKISDCVQNMAAISRTDSKCTVCDYCKNCINGMYCTRLNIYVEYFSEPPCENKNNQ